MTTTLLAARSAGQGSGTRDPDGPEDGDEERCEPADPHPDIPDDMDEDAVPARQSEEAVPEQ